ncbi:MAG: glucose-6-phosphate isomerase [Actinomycetota bacterium]|nr:glucose-6-phosphate isomerase [Actinomycetota bacterium]
MSKVTLGVLASGPAADAVARHVPQLVAEGFAGRLFVKDPTLWGPEARSESEVRLSWVSLGRTSRPLIGEVAALRDLLAEQGVDHVVLCGMGGSSLAPEVICATAGVELTVLDSSYPETVRAALADRLDRAVVVVSSKSGSTVETDSQRRAFKDAFTQAGIDPRQRIVIVTDPGSPLDQEARADGYRVINADPNVGGRYSALTAFGLVPSGLAGVDLEQLLDEAESVADLLADDDEANPALQLGSAMAGTEPLRDKLVLVDNGSGIPGFADWAEQLIAESTGKSGTGVLPVVVQDDRDPEVQSPSDDVTLARLVADVADVHDDEGDSDQHDPVVPSVTDPTRSEIQVSGSLGAQLLMWEVATVAAGRILGINPFDQPDVESAKKATRGLLEATGAKPDPAAFTDGAIEVRALGGDWLTKSGTAASTVAGAVDSLLAQVDPKHGYVAIMAYLDRLADTDLARARRVIAKRTQTPTTFGWGPRFLHSTGQYHKGGPGTGVYLQITAEPREDLAIPGREFTFGSFIKAQAGGDAQVLADHGRPVLRLHLTDHNAGLAQLRQALGLDSPAESGTGSVTGP